MMNTDFIDLIYENEEVEGLAVFSRNGVLVENQLVLAKDSVAIVSETVTNIANALGAVKRDLRGFLIRSNKITLQICVFDELILLIQVTEPFSANKIEKSVRSIMNGISLDSAPPVAIPSQPSPITEAVSQPGLPAASNVAAARESVDEPVQEEVIDGITLDSFKQKITQLLKRVAPGGIADKMIAEVLTAEGVDSVASLDKARAVQIGATIITKIPNKSRRKLIEKEYELLVKTF